MFWHSMRFRKEVLAFNEVWEGGFGIQEGLGRRFWYSRRFRKEVLVFKVV